MDEFGGYKNKETQWVAVYLDNFRSDFELEKYDSIRAAFEDALSQNSPIDLDKVDWSEIEGPARQTPDDLETRLGQFSGASRYHRFASYPNLGLSDGVLYLAQQAGFWLLESIGSHQVNPKIRGTQNQFWTLRVDESRSALLVCADQDHRVLMTQNIPYTDFPMARITLFVGPAENGQVISLASER